MLEVYEEQERPPVVHWGGDNYLVLAEFPHGECICAVQLATEKPLIDWGYDGEPNSFGFPMPFEEWLKTHAQRVLAGNSEPHPMPKSRFTANPQSLERVLKAGTLILLAIGLGIFAILFRSPLLGIIAVGLTIFSWIILWQLYRTRTTG